MITFPNAKINLGLYVERKREDGYHDLSTVFYPIPLTDAVEVVEAKETALFTYGNPVDCPPEKNLVMKAYRLMEEEFKLPPVAIHLYKHIPSNNPRLHTRQIRKISTTLSNNSAQYPIHTRERKNNKENRSD